MFSAALTVLTVFMLLVISELLWRRKSMHHELTRKFVHLTVGTFVAFWPFFLSWGMIQLLSVAFLLVVGFSKYFRVFRAIHSVQRPTWGELFFALVVGALTFVTHDKWIYAVSLLQMSLADGLAAVIGTRLGSPGRYHILGHTKSIVGTLTFMTVSVGILVAYSAVHMALGMEIIIPIALAAALLENIGVYGSDNLLVPLLIAYVLSR